MGVALHLVRLSGAQYLRELQNASSEVQDAIAVFDTYEEINRLALSDGAVRATLDADAEFWNVVIHSLQTTLFIALARIFDTDTNNHSIHRFINITLANYELFSRKALMERRIAANGGVEPDWLGEFIQGTWEPNSSSDLRPLKKELAPYARKFKDVYRPIRHSFIAHRAINITEASKLFEKTNRAEIGEILAFLHDLTDAIWQLYNNGIKPELGTRVSENLKSPSKWTVESTKSLISKLVQHSQGK